MLVKLLINMLVNFWIGLLWKDASLVDGGKWKTGCGIFETHGDWVRVGECGLVDEIVVLLNNRIVWNNAVVWNTGVVVKEGVVWNNGVV